MTSIYKVRQTLLFTLSIANIFTLKRALITITDFPRTYRRSTTTDHRVVPTGESCKGNYAGILSDFGAYDSVQLTLTCISAASPLDEPYKRFVEDPSSKGTIYVAFGSLVQWDSGQREVYYQ